MTIAEIKPTRQNRTMTLHLGNTLAEYETTYLTEAGIKVLIRKVEIADNLHWGYLACNSLNLIQQTVSDLGSAKQFYSSLGPGVKLFCLHYNQIIIQIIQRKSTIAR